MTNLLKAKSKFRAVGILLYANDRKSGDGGSWNFVNEQQLITEINKPLFDCGLEIFTLMSSKDGVITVNVTLFHIESGESITSSMGLVAVSPNKDKNGNPRYLDAEIEKGKQVGYWTRILTMKLLGLASSPTDYLNNEIVPLLDNEIVGMDSDIVKSILSQEITTGNRTFIMKKIKENALLRKDAEKFLKDMTCGK